MKFNSLQILRGLAAWLVVYHHYVYIFYILQNKNTGNVGYFFGKFGGFGVDVFFVLSGFIMFVSLQNKIKGGTEYFLNRILRIMPLYWFYFLILFLFTILLNKHVFFANYNLETLFQSFFLIPHKNLNGSGYYPVLYVGWTLTYEMFFYLILTCSIILNKNKALLICSIALIIIPILTYSLDVTFLGNNKFLLWEFVSGIFIGYVFKFYKNLIEKYFVYFQLLIITSIPVLLDLLGWSFYSKFIIASQIVLLFLLSEKSIKQENKLIKFFVKLGDYSYSTYLSHIIVISVFLYFFENKVNNLLTEIMVLISISIFVYLSSRITFTYVENGSWVQIVKEKIKKKQIV